MESIVVLYESAVQVVLAVLNAFVVPVIAQHMCS